MLRSVVADIGVHQPWTQAMRHVVYQGADGSLAAFHLPEARLWIRKDVYVDIVTVRWHEVSQKLASARRTISRNQRAA